MTSPEEAWQIYNVLAATRRNRDLLDRPYAALPCLIEFSASAVITFVAGRYRQMAFLLDSLRRAFPRDYDANQRSRELSMQRGIEKLFGEYFPDLEFRRNVHLRHEGRALTDIDLVVIDRQFGDLFLIQIKFQDRPGPDFRAEASRAARFRDESDRWLSAVNSWLEDGNEARLRSAFRIPRKIPVTRIRKLVLARHQAWPLRGLELDENTAYANWEQLVNVALLIEKSQGDFRTLNGLYRLLRKHIVGSAPRHHENEGPVEYVLNSLKFAICHEMDIKGESA